MEVEKEEAGRRSQSSFNGTTVSVEPIFSETREVGFSRYSRGSNVSAISRRINDDWLLESPADRVVD